MQIEKLKKEVQQFIALNNFKELTKIQTAVLDLALKNKDVIAIGDTGTGKTHAYLIPLLQMIDPNLEETQAIISLPTRELALQIEKVARLMKEIYPQLKISLLVGGYDNKRSLKALNRVPHIVIGTPARLKDFFAQNAFRVDKAKMFIIDEADMTLEYGFLEDIDVLFSRMNKDVQILCFSATLPENFKPFAKRYLNNPQIIRVEEEKINPQILYKAISCKHKSYSETVLDILPLFEPYICLIFANSRNECEEVHNSLSENGYKNLLLHGGLSSRERQRGIRSMLKEEYHYVVASDIASRGLDLEGISHVISLGLPKDLSFFIHRAGRTGRSGREGTCFTLYKEEDIPLLKKLKEKGINFSFVAYRNKSWQKAHNPLSKRKKLNSQAQIDIAKILTKKKTKVKPNYKKKQQAAIAEIERKAKRDFIRGKIKEEKKKRYKELARNKYNSKD